MRTLSSDAEAETFDGCTENCKYELNVGDAAADAVVTAIPPPRSNAAYSTASSRIMYGMMLPISTLPIRPAKKSSSMIVGLSSLMLASETHNSDGRVPLSGKF